jgi:hypothetical protein
MGLLDILNQYTNPSAAPTGNVMEHFDQVAQQAPPQDLGRGIAAALRSDSTPPFGQLVGNLFGQSNPQQQAGVLNQLIQSIGPGALSGVAGGILGRVLGGGSSSAVPTITPAQASQLSPADVNAIATHAQNQDGSVVDKIGGFYAEHPTLVKSLGAAALAIALGHMRSQN